MEWKLWVIYFRLPGHICQTNGACRWMPLLHTKLILLVNYSVLGSLLLFVVYPVFPVSPAAGRSLGVGLLSFFQLQPAQCLLCCWVTALDSTDPRHFARQCLGFFFCQRNFWRHSPVFPQTVGKMGSFSCGMAQTLPGAAAKGAGVHFFKAVLLSCFHQQDTVKSQHFTLAHNVFSWSVPWNAINYCLAQFCISLAEHHLAGSGRHKEFLLQIIQFQAEVWNSDHAFAFQTMLQRGFKHHRSSLAGFSLSGSVFARAGTALNLEPPVCCRDASLHSSSHR